MANAANRNLLVEAIPHQPNYDAGFIEESYYFRKDKRILRMTMWKDRASKLDKLEADHALCELSQYYPRTHGGKESRRRKMMEISQTLCLTCDPFPSSKRSAASNSSRGEREETWRCVT